VERATAPSSMASRSTARRSSRRKWVSAIPKLEPVLAVAHCNTAWEEEEKEEEVVVAVVVVEAEEEEEQAEEEEEDEGED
jgi:hypothetical protein